MSDAIALDLFIQDFVTTNKVMNTHVNWPSLVNRRFTEDGVKKVFEFQSGGAKHYAVGQHLALPEADWLRIDLTRTIPPVEEHRFDCLRMMHAETHTGFAVERLVEKNVVLIRLTTRHRGLINVVFVIRDGLAVENPFLA
jgi:hypothetical protein